MLPSWIVFVGAGISVLGAISYIRLVLAGEAQPNLVTWSMWAIAPLTAFVIELQEGVGVSSTMTLIIGLIPCAVLLAGWHSKSMIWKLGPFDLACGFLSVVGLIVWLASDQATLGLLAQVTADTVAAFPTLRKSFFTPESEGQGPYLTGTLNAGLTMLTLHHWTTAEVAFPLAIFVADIIIWLFILTKVGTRFRVTPANSANL